jgi:NAD(P)-dependent dehydrogenase (short-subunit alcohol dehydrogenase family)
MSNPLFDVQGKVVIVTGASRGIGQAIAAAFVQAGSKVVLASRRQENLDAVAAQLREQGGDVLAIPAHAGKKETLQALVEQTMTHYGTVDVLINNAATSPHYGPVLQAEDSMWTKTIEVNLMGNVWLCQQVVPVMRQQGGGKIINIASIVAAHPGQHMGIYSMTKAAVVSLTQTLAMDLGADNIQVNAIAPGLVQTRFAQGLWGDDALRSSVEARTPAGRIGQPDDIAGMALWLASPASAFTTGAVFTVDGGFTLRSL